MSGMSDFDATVVEFMRDFGTTATILTNHSGSYDPSTSRFTQYGTNITVKAILMDRTLRSDGDQNSPNSLIQAGDKQCFIQPPEKNGGSAIHIDTVSDQLLIGGVTYRIVTVKSLNPSTTNSVLYELYLRK